MFSTFEIVADDNSHNYPNDDEDNQGENKAYPPLLTGGTSGYYSLLSVGETIGHDQ
jgi:hypothetical protein